MDGNPHFPTMGLNMTVANNSEVYKSSDDSIIAWIEQEASIHLKAITFYGDPVELTTQEARILAKKLVEFADKIDALD